MGACAYANSIKSHLLAPIMFFSEIKSCMYLGDSRWFNFSFTRIKKSRSILQDHKFQKCFERKEKLIIYIYF